MAFSTQREFLATEVLNRIPNFPEDISQKYSLKSYKSCADPRGWSMSDRKRTGYLMDLLKDKRKYEHVGENGSLEEIYKLDLDARHKKSETTTEDDSTDRSDSLIYGARATLKDIEQAVDHVDVDVKPKSKTETVKIKKEKKSPSKIEHQSETREKNVKKLSHEAKKTTPDVDMKLLKKEIERLRAERKQYEGLVEENADLKRQIKTLKLSGKVEMDGAKVKIEKKNLSNESLSRREKDTLDAVVKERDRLRDQIKRMADVEPKIAELRRRAIEADKLEAERDNLKLWFTELTKKYRDLREKSENQTEAEPNPKPSKELVKSKVENELLMKKLSSCENIKRELDFYKDHFNRLFTELSKIRDQLQLQGRLYSQYELLSTKRKLCRAENTIQEYEQQMEQLLNHLRELSGAFSVMDDLYENVKNLTILCLNANLVSNAGYRNYVYLRLQERSKA